MTTSDKERELLESFGLTEEQIEADVKRLEDESQDDGIIGPIYYGLHMLPERDEELVSMTVKLPKSQFEAVTAAAERYHISRSEYVRRKLASA